MKLSFDEIRNYNLDSTFSRQDVNQINLIDLAISYGYTHKTEKSTTNWIVLQNPITNDKIAIKNNSEQWYFNPKDDLDKGKAFNFILNRLDDNLNVLRNPTGFEKRTVYVMASKYLNKENIKIQKKPLNKIIDTKPKTTTTLKTLDFINKSFLKSRGLSVKTLNSPFFKNRIFNSKVPGKNNGFITNTAFPLYNVHTSKIEGWTTRNKKYTNKKGELINPTYFFGNTNALWLSNTPKELKNICYGESEIDALSHYELNPNNNTLYVSFDGNLNEEKLNNLLELFEINTKKNDKINLTSITDNDLAGYSYDFKILSNLINKNNSNYHLSFIKRKDFFEFQIISKNDKEIDIKNEWKYFIEDFNKINTIQKNTIDAKIFIKNLEHPTYNIKLNTANDLTHFQTLYRILKDKYLPNLTLKLNKSISNDWNDDLKLKNHTKKKNNLLKI